MAVITASGYTAFTNADPEATYFYYNNFSGGNERDGAFIAGAGADAQSLSALSNPSTMRPFWRRPQRKIP